MEAMTVFFLLLITLAVYGLVSLHMNLTLFSQFCEECRCNFDVDCIESILPCVTEAFLRCSTNLKVWKVIPISCAFFNLFLQCLDFSLQSPFSSLVTQAYSQVFVVFGAVLGGIIFLISFSAGSLLAYIKTTGLYVNIVWCNFLYLSDFKVFN